MGNCKITTWKFKELPLQDPQEPRQSASPSNSSNSYHHNNENELFLVGYKYIDSTKCPEIKVRLSDIMRGGGDDSGGDGGGCDCDLALRYDPTNNRLYYSLDGDTTGSKTEWVDLSALDTSFNSIEFNWLPSNGTATASVNNNKLYLSLPVPAGSGGGDGTLPSNIPVIVTQTATKPTGSFENGILTLNLVPGQQGPKGERGATGATGRDGKDGASFKLYKVKLDFEGVVGDKYTQKHTSSNGIPVYKLNPKTYVWYQYNPETNEYVKLSQKPEIGNKYVEVGPSDIWVEPSGNGTGWNAATNYYVPGMNAYFKTYGFYNYSSDNFEFYSAYNTFTNNSYNGPTTIANNINSPLQFSVKVYENIQYDGSGGQDEPVSLDYKYTITGSYGNATTIPTTVPTGLTANSNVTGTCYYIKESTVAGNGKLKIYIPSDKVIETFYEYSGATWVERHDTATNHIDLATETIQNTTYNVYTLYKYNSDQEPIEGMIRLSFGVSGARVNVEEGDD